MSHYLLDRIKRSPRIEVITETELIAVHGTATVESVTLRDRRDGSVEQVPAAAVFVMIGGDPCTEAATGILAVDDGGFLLCGDGAAGCEGHLGWPLTDREPHLLETVRPRCVRGRRRPRGCVEPCRRRGRRRRDGRAVRDAGAGRLAVDHFWTAHNEDASEAGCFADPRRVSAGFQPVDRGRIQVRLQQQLRPRGCSPQIG